MRVKFPIYNHNLIKETKIEAKILNSDKKVAKISEVDKLNNKNDFIQQTLH